MVIDLATIDFAPGQGGGEAVIRTLTATENGVYRAPSGVDGFNPVTVDLPLDDYATKEWVQDQGYLSEDDPAIEPLANPSAGVLTTAELRPLSCEILTEIDNASELQNRVYNINGDIYAFVETYLYKYDKSTFHFNKELRCDGNNWKPLWGDESGRIFQGVNYEINLSTGQMSSVDLGASYYTYNYNVDTIYKGNNGIYLFSVGSPQKYNETLKKFESFPITFATGLGEDSLMYMFEWNGHHLCLPPAGGMYELIESENSAEVVEVVTPYFDLYAGENNDIQVYNHYSYSKIIVSTSDGLYFLSSTDHFKLSSDGHWVRNTIKDRENMDYPVNYASYGGLAIDDYFVGFRYVDISKLAFTNPKNTEIIATGWNDINNMAVGLTGNQKITGTKTFEYITANTVTLNQLNGSSDLRVIVPNTLNISGKKINIDPQNLLLTGGKNIATTDDCILNRSYSSTGPYFEAVTSNMNFEYGYYFRVPSGRVFYKNPMDSNYYEFNGSTWTQIQFTYSIIPESVMNAIGNTFAFDNNASIYLWNESSSDWDLILYNGQYSYDRIYTWVCGDTLRYSSYLKLVNNGGVWNWESDDVSDWKYGKALLYNNTVYVFSNSQLYTYDESTKTYTYLNEWYNDSVWNIFIFDGDLYYEAYQTIYKFDFSQVSGTTQEFNVETDIFILVPAQIYVEYSGKLYTVNNSNEFGYVYGKTETLPTVPASNGTYVLKATRTGDAVVYEWVPEV